MTKKTNLMKSIADGITCCVDTEHKSIFKYILQNKPNLKYTVNNNGVFISLKDLTIPHLEHINSIIKYAKQQAKKEQKRIREQNTLKKNYM